MPSNTVYIPQQYPLDSSKIQGAGKGVFAICAANTTTNLDLTFTDDTILTGVQFITSGASLGDNITLQILVGGNVVASPIPGPWYVAVNQNETFDLIIPQKVLVGMTIRIVYSATVILVTPTIAVNYKLWKVLI